MIYKYNKINKVVVLQKLELFMFIFSLNRHD
mgnify:FL=1